MGISNRPMYGMDHATMRDVDNHQTPSKLGSSGVESANSSNEGSRVPGDIGGMNTTAPSSNGGLPSGYLPDKSPGVPNPDQTAVPSISGEARGYPSQSSMGTTITGGAAAQRQAASEQMADAVTAKSDQADTKVLRDQSLKDAVARNAASKMPSGGGRK